MCLEVGRRRGGADKGTRIAERRYTIRLCKRRRLVSREVKRRVGFTIPISAPLLEDRIFVVWKKGTRVESLMHKASKALSSTETCGAEQ